MEHRQILVNRMFFIPRRDRLILRGVFLLLFAALPLAILAVLYNAGISPSEAQWHAFFRKVSDEIGSHFREEPLDAWVNMLVLFSLPAYLLYFSLSRRRERLILTPEAIRYVSPLPDALEFLRPGWTLPWEQVRAARLESPTLGDPAKTTSLVLDTFRGKRKLLPWFWIDPDEHRTESVLSRFKKMPAGAARRLLMQSPVVAFINKEVAHLTIEAEAEPHQKAADLTKNPWSLGMVILFFALLVYALADTFFLNSETYAGRPPYGLCIAAGLAMTMAGSAMLYRRLPLTETAVVSVLTGMAFGCAMYPGLLRINQLTDQTGLQTCQYELQADGRYLPLEDGPPVLVFDEHRDYWNQFSSGSIHRFELRRGGLGFWQLNRASILEGYRDYYENKP